nr:hypothetical protein CFP56_37099 [Quercus suber]
MCQIQDKSCGNLALAISARRTRKGQDNVDRDRLPELSYVSHQAMGRVVSCKSRIRTKTESLSSMLHLADLVQATAFPARGLVSSCGHRFILAVQRESGSSVLPRVILKREIGGQPARDKKDWELVFGGAGRKNGFSNTSKSPTAKRETNFGSYCTKSLLTWVENKQTEHRANMTARRP